MHARPTDRSVLNPATDQLSDSVYPLFRTLVLLSKCTWTPQQWRQRECRAFQHNVSCITPVRSKAGTNLDLTSVRVLPNPGTITSNVCPPRIFRVSGRSWRLSSPVLWATANSIPSAVTSAEVARSRMIPAISRSFKPHRTLLEACMECQLS